MEASEREVLVDRVMQEKMLLPSNPTIEDLMRFSKIRLKKKRNLKKFRKYWWRYVSERIRKEFQSKAMVTPIRRALREDSFARKILPPAPLHRLKEK